MDTLQYIDTYFSTIATPESQEVFEQKMAADPAFAEEVAFYLSAKQAAAELASVEKREWFRELYDRNKQNNHSPVSRPVIRRLWPYLAAAAVLTAVIIGWALFSRPVSAVQLADRYIQEHFRELPVTMGAKEDSIQAGLQLFNNGKLQDALLQFESIAERDTASWVAKKYAGIVCLRLLQYDKAIRYFTQLDNTTQLYANPGRFYRALALLKRNGPGDKPAARDLLKQVVEQDLEGKAFAEQLLDKW